MSIRDAYYAVRLGISLRREAVQLVLVHTAGLRVASEIRDSKGETIYEKGRINASVTLMIEYGIGGPTMVVFGRCCRGPGTLLSKRGNVLFCLVGDNPNPLTIFSP
jgi:hypothetical protein